MELRNTEEKSISVEYLLSEFKFWKENHPNNNISYNQYDVITDGIILHLSLDQEFNFELQCPLEYPKHCENFFIPNFDPRIKFWANILNEYLLDCSPNILLTQILNKFSSVQWNENDCSSISSEDECMDDDFENEEIPALSQDNFFTTEWEIMIARNKKKWSQKETELRQKMNRFKMSTNLSEFSSIHVTGQEKDQAMQIFTSSAASGILTNDLIKILERDKDFGYTADPIDDNIYQWSVHLFNFTPGSDLDRDLVETQKKFGYNWIELQLDFAIDLYPFYPPIVKVIRPRLQGSMMQRVTNMEMLKLSHWNPARDMSSILLDIKKFLQQWARLEADNERNDPKRYPHGSYVDIEHHLLRLALVSEVSPRVNLKYHLELDKFNDISSLKSFYINMANNGKLDDQFHHNKDKRREEYWAPGVGYGHHNRPEWDIRSYVAAQKEKDKQIESVLHKILQELKILYIRHRSLLFQQVKYDQPIVSNSSSSAAFSSDPSSPKHFINTSLSIFPTLTSQINNPNNDSSDSLILNSQSSCQKTSVSSNEQFEIDKNSTSIDESSQESPMNGDGIALPVTISYDALQGTPKKMRKSISSNTTAELNNIACSQDSCRALLIEEKMFDVVDPVTDVFNILEGSALIPFAEQYLKTDSFTEIFRHTLVYRVLVDIIRELSLQPQMLPLLGKLTDQLVSIYQLLANLEQKASSLLQRICKAGNGCIPKQIKKESIFSSLKRGKDRSSHSSEHISNVSADTHNATSAEEKLAREFQCLFKDVSEAFRRQNLDPNEIPDFISESIPIVEINPIISSIELSLEEKYKLVMSELQFLPFNFDLEGSSAHHFAKLFKKQDALNQCQIFRIAQELTSISISLPLNLSSAIFVRTDDDKLTLMKALIIGPDDTPYSCGCFLFDIFFQSGYPKQPPLVNLQTTGGGTVRFNPNLYNCGKVCLSLLGTWDGQQGEQWNETTSTILQVLVSIQSLILVPEPYFNEPGYEQEIGTEPGDKHSAEYNLDVRINTIKHAMIAQLQNPSVGFEDVIRSHFYLKKDILLEEAERWCRTNKSSKLERVTQNLKSELQKLEPPLPIKNLLNQNSGPDITINPSIETNL